MENQSLSNPFVSQQQPYVKKKVRVKSAGYRSKKNKSSEKLNKRITLVLMGIIVLAFVAALGTILVSAASPAAQETENPEYVSNP